ncbi:hypothetical protein WG66_016835 [Moniliophthora roreri]|nr:hypothetical protein WG66_016835 [Moniliophthora roreri]
MTSRIVLWGNANNNGRLLSTMMFVTIDFSCGPYTALGMGLLEYFNTGTPEVRYSGIYRSY